MTKYTLKDITRASGGFAMLAVDQLVGLHWVNSRHINH